jgi:hypothetical protein
VTDAIVKLCECGSQLESVKDEGERFLKSANGSCQTREGSRSLEEVATGLQALPEKYISGAS